MRPSTDRNGADHAARWYRRILSLLPGEFRDDFGRDMHADFRDELAAARADGSIAVARLWMRTIGGLFTTGLRQHLADLVSDTRMAFRVMGRTRWSSLVAIMMIALGTGANAAVFSVVDGVMLRHPFPNADRVVIVRERTAAGQITNAVPVSHFRQLQAQLGPFDAVAAIAGGGPILTDGDVPRRLTLECVSAEMLPVLGVRPILGRAFTRDEDRAGAADVIVISHALWRQTLGGRADAIGQTIHLNGAPAIVIGVMPDWFGGVWSRGDVDGWAPLEPALAGTSAIGCVRRGDLNVRASLAIGQSLADAEREANARIVLGGPGGTSEGDRRSSPTISLIRNDDQVFGEVRAPFIALLGAVGCVLLIACANVANMQLERAIGRRQEMGIRLALGATRSRIVRQTLTETILLCLVGAAVGVAIATPTLRVIVDLMPGWIPNLAQVTMSGRVLIASGVIALLTGLVAGGVPAIHATRTRLTGDLAAVSRSATRAGRWGPRVLAAGEIAVSLVLVVCAALMLRTFLTLRPSDPGFDPSGKVVATIRFQDSVLGTVPAAPLVARMTEDLLAQGSVASVSASNYLPMSGSVSMASVGAGTTRADIFTGIVSPNYVDELRIPIARGRAFTGADGPGTPPVALVNEAFVARFLAGRDPIGHMVTVTFYGQAATPRQIVGLLRNTRSAGADVRARAELYAPLAQVPTPFVHLLVRGIPGTPRPQVDRAIQRTVNRFLPGQVISRLTSLDDIVDRSVATPRFGAWLFGAFAGMAVLLAAVGLAAVMARGVAQRTREIGVRLALGATPRGILQLVLGESARVAGAGVIVGLALAALATRLVETWLFGVSRLDPLVFVGGAVGMFAIALAASYLPARRTARIDPLRVLRMD